MDNGYGLSNIFNAESKQPMCKYFILKNILVCAISPENINPLIAVTMLKDKDIADALYNYVMYEMIDKRDGADSMLMSDSEANEFIDMLINSC